MTRSDLVEAVLDTTLLHVIPAMGFISINFQPPTLCGIVRPWTYGTVNPSDPNTMWVRSFSDLRVCTPDGHSPCPVCLSRGNRGP